MGLVILFPEPIGPVLVKTATVCWMGGPDCGLRLVAVHPVEAVSLRQCVTQAVRKGIRCTISDALTTRRRALMLAGDDPAAVADVSTGF